MVDIPTNKKDLGEEFEYESGLSKEELIKFLEELIGQLKKEDKVTVSVLGAEGSMAFTEPISLEVECEYKKSGNRELEIELEFREKA